MIDNDILKAAIVAKLKTHSPLVALLPEGQDGIKEYEWRGTIFQYPNVRVRIDSQVDTSPDSNCDIMSVSWSIFVFSEKHSSQEADSIAGLIARFFRGLNFSYTGVKFVRAEIAELVPAITQDERTWRSQVRCRSVIN